MQKETLKKLGDRSLLEESREVEMASSSAGGSLEAVQEEKEEEESSPKTNGKGKGTTTKGE